MRGCRVPSKTAKHLTVLGLFEIALSKRRAKIFGRAILVFSDFLFKHVRAEKKRKKRRREKEKEEEEVVVVGGGGGGGGGSSSRCL